jgi:hypothetical protein
MKIKTRRLRRKSGSVLGGYGKGTEFCTSLNFGRSASQDCSLGCPHNPLSDIPGAPGDCYAVRIELRFDRKQLRDKLDRHEAMGPALVCGKAILELQEHFRLGHRIDFLRISTNGAVPEWDSPKCSNLFKKQFKVLLEFAVANGIAVHFPVETWEKAEGYRSLVGDIVAVRESVHKENEFVNKPGACATTAGAGLPLLQRIAAARVLARKRYAATGRKTIVCPAIAASFKHRLCRDAAEKPRLKAIADRAKCGNCDACANKAVDIVYPAH